MKNFRNACYTQRPNEYNLTEPFSGNFRDAP